MELRCFRVGTWSSVGWARSWVLLQHSCEGHDLHCMPWAGGLSVTLGQLLLLGKPTREDDQDIFQQVPLASELRMRR